MFTGIIEAFGVVSFVRKENTNLHLSIKCDFTSELRVDQSVAHNGVCLTVVEIENDEYTVTAIKETLRKTALEDVELGDVLNLERAMKLGDRLDGHIVQGHVDQVGVCTSILDENGSTLFTFGYDPSKNNITIEKGSITINGVSLTVLNSKSNEFSVAIIPYTMKHTIFQYLKINDKVNLEFDVLGKYVSRLQSLKS